MADGYSLVAAFVGLPELFGIVYLSLYCFPCIDAGRSVLQFGRVVVAFFHLRLEFRRMVEIPLHIVRFLAADGEQEQGGGAKQEFVHSGFLIGQNGLAAGDQAA